MYSFCPKQHANLTPIFHTLFCVCCVFPYLHACFTQSYCIIDVCLHAQSKGPAVYACVFAILFGCLPLFARMNTNWAEFLMARDAVVVSKILPPLSLFPWSLNTDIALLLAGFWCYSCPLTQPRVVWLCVVSNIVTPLSSVFLWPSIQAKVWTLLACCPEQWASCAFLPLCMPHCFLFLFP